MTGKRIRSATGMFAAVVLAAGIGAWASYEAFSGVTADEDTDGGHLIAVAEYGSVERVLSLNTAAAWKSVSSIGNLASGTVTEAYHADGDEVEAGDVLYTVDLEPVVAAEGRIPAFRALSRGDEGEDVAQLQRLLQSTGHYSGEDDGDFGSGLHYAVRAWQDDIGAEVTGSVAPGAVLFVPDLPVRAALGGDIEPGTAVSAGSTALELLPTSPEFIITMTDNHARAVEVGMVVRLQSGDATWTAVVAEMRTDEHDARQAVLAPAEGETICGERCADVPLGDGVLLRSEIVVVPATEGVTVPAAAIATDGSGGTVVVAESGERLDVEILAGADGTVVVEGIEAGTRVRVPGEPGA